MNELLLFSNLMLFITLLFLVLSCSFAHHKNVQDKQKQTISTEDDIWSYKLIVRKLKSAWWEKEEWEEKSFLLDTEEEARKRFKDILDCSGIYACGPYHDDDGFSYKECCQRMKYKTCEYQVHVIKVPRE